ncbi:hypothetical protein IAD21_04571 [Abditibacteriota bacterium]|nr:hypothetical protein IAD21_04571 [Abditibacteriota bacterium]
MPQKERFSFVAQPTILNAVKWIISLIIGRHLTFEPKSVGNLMARRAFVLIFSHNSGARIERS